MLSKFRDDNLILLAHNFQTAVVTVLRSLLPNSYELRSQMAESSTVLYAVHSPWLTY